MGCSIFSQSDSILTTPAFPYTHYDSSPLPTTSLSGQFAVVSLWRKCHSSPYPQYTLVKSCLRMNRLF